MTHLTWPAGNPTLGKDITNDLREGTYSLAVLDTLAHPDHGPPLAAVLGRVHLYPADIATAIDLIRASGGIQHAMDTAHQHAAHARAALQVLPTGPARTTLTRLTDYVVTGNVPTAVDLAAALRMQTYELISCNSLGHRQHNLLGVGPSRNRLDPR